MLRALYRVVLWCCPADIRNRRGAEAEEIFLHCVGVEQGRRRRLWWPFVWARGLTDGLVFATFAWQERRTDRLHRSHQPGNRKMWRRFMRIQDIRTTLRFMRTRPLFAMGTISMLSLGVGATIAIASVIYTVLLRPLPFPEPDRLVSVWESLPARAIDRMSLTEAF